MEPRYKAYGDWLKRRFGERVHKVSVDGGFTCPNRDGSLSRGGCDYCDNDSFRAREVSAGDSVETQIRNGIAFLSRRFRVTKFLVYWQHYTNTYAPVETLRDRFSRSLRVDPRIVGICVGTRPDCVEEEKLALCEELSCTHYVCLEYGLESIYDDTLRRINRGHDVGCFSDAVRRTHRRGLPVCAHIIFGFPWESRDEMLAYANFLNHLEVEFVKIHHLHVVQDTALAQAYLADPFPTLDFPSWVSLVCDFLERLSSRIVVQRLFGWAPETEVLAPRWGLSRTEIKQGILSELERRDTRQGKLAPIA